MREYRLTTLADAEAFLDLLLKSYQPIRDLGIHFAAATADLDLVTHHIQQNLCYVLEDDGRLIATISLRLPWGPNPGPEVLPHIGWFAVDPDFSGQGIGNDLLDWLEQEILIKELKAPAVTLGTADKHPWLAMMYQRKGYQKFAEKDLGKGHLTLFFKKEFQLVESKEGL